MLGTLGISQQQIQLEAERLKQEAERKHLQAFVDRFGSDPIVARFQQQVAVEEVGQ